MEFLETKNISLNRCLFIPFSYVTEFLLLDILVRHVFIYYHYPVTKLLYIFFFRFHRVSTYHYVPLTKTALVTQPTRLTAFYWSID